MLCGLSDVLQAFGYLLHATASQQRDADPEAWDRSLSFAVVRNPFDWLVSSFFYLLEKKCDKVPPHHCQVRASYVCCVHGHSSVCDTGFVYVAARQARPAHVPTITRCCALCRQFPVNRGLGSARTSP